MKKRLKRIIRFAQDRWNNTYCILIPSVVAYVYYRAYSKHSLDMMNSDYFITLLEAILTAVTILTGFMAALLGAIVQGRDTSPTIIRFFEYIGDEGELRFIRQLRHSILGGLLLIFLTGFLFLSDVFTENILYCILIWIWLLVYFGASTYRFIAIFLSLLLKKSKPMEQKMRSAYSAEERAAFDERLRAKSQRRESTTEDTQS